MKRVRLLLVVALIVELLPILAHAQQQRRIKPREQSQFGVEEKITHPVSVPEDVLQILRRDEHNQNCLATNASPDKIPASWFVASKIHLNNDNLSDLVVAAANPCLFGANINPFWVFRNTPQGYKLALSVSTLGLKALNTRTRGFRDIRSDAATGIEVFTTIFKFNGREYRAQRFWRKPI